MLHQWVAIINKISKRLVLHKPKRKLMFYNNHCKFLTGNQWIKFMNPSSPLSVFAKCYLFSRTSSIVGILKLWIWLVCLFKWLIPDPQERIVPQWLHFAFATPPTFIFVKWSQQFETTLRFLFLSLCVSSWTFSDSKMDLKAN